MMVRRLDLQSDKKLRNPDRHLRSLHRWAATADKLLPKRHTLEQWSDNHLQLRAPITSKLVTPPHATAETCSRVAQALLDAAGTISQSLELERPIRIACLIEPEDLWKSGVNLFFDEAYFYTFLPPADHGTHIHGKFTVTTAPPEVDLVADWALTLPSGFFDFGGYRITMTDTDDPGYLWDAHHWVIGEAEARRHP